MTITEAKREATMKAAMTGEAWAVCDDLEGRLFVVPADSYLDSQLLVIEPPKA